MDSGNDALDNLVECQKFNQQHKSIQIDYIIKRNLRKESPLEWLDLARKSGPSTQPRAGKKVYFGRCVREYAELEKPVSIVYKVIERTIDCKGQQLLVPEVEAEIYSVFASDSPSTTSFGYSRLHLPGRSINPAFAPMDFGLW